MKKKILTAMIAAALLAMLTACGGTASTSTDNGSAQNTASQKAEEKQPADLTGDWKQVNSSSDDSYQQATISGDTIEIYWVSDNGDSKSLYWAGSLKHQRQHMNRTAGNPRTIMTRPTAHLWHLLMTPRSLPMRKTRSVMKRLHWAQPQPSGLKNRIKNPRIQ